MKRSGFTMIELIFVIVILGILAAVAIPKLAATRDDAKVAKLNSDAATFVSDIGAYYTSKGTFGTAFVGDVTNVAFVEPSATTTLAGATLHLANGTAAAQSCLIFKPFTVATGDGNMTISVGTDTTSNVCKAVQAAAVKSNLLGASNADKNVSFGGTSVVQ
ncbi:type II secretion system protein [Sulfuricurvum sp.]|uniref:type II secretion system protein n=1 Tax=Sulfuricurvum sp. TaxID=2025608 RepID=UPI0035690B31